MKTLLTIILLACLDCGIDPSASLNEARRRGYDVEAAEKNHELDVRELELKEAKRKLDERKAEATK